MNIKNDDISRITIDMPKMDHKRLKALAAFTGKSMREIVLEFIERGINEYQAEVTCPLSHKSNKETVEALECSNKKENLVKVDSVDDLLRCIDKHSD